MIHHFQLKLWVAPFKNCAGDCMDVSESRNLEKEVQCFHNCLLREKEMSRMMTFSSKHMGLKYE